MLLLLLLFISQFLCTSATVELDATTGKITKINDVQYNNVNTFYDKISGARKVHFAACVKFGEVVIKDCAKSASIENERKVLEKLKLEKNDYAIHVHDIMPPPLTFIVNVFNFLDRKDLEIVSNTSTYVNRIVRKHFPSKPFRFLNDVTIRIIRDEDGLGVALVSQKYAEDESSGSHDANEEGSGSQDTENQSSGDIIFNPYKNEWNKDFALEIMRPFLSQFVRFGKAQLFCDEHPYTAEDMMILASISHVWSGRSLWLCVRWKIVENLQEPPMNFRNNASNSIRNILSHDAIFSARCLDLHDAAQFVSLQDYSRVYTVDLLLLKSYDDDILNIGTLLALIEHKPQFPESKTVFVVDISTFVTPEAEVTDAIRKSFSTASTQCSFQLVIIDHESNGESEEFRLENETTREVLELKNVKKGSPFVTKICEACNHEEFEYDKFNLIERSRL